MEDMESVILTANTAASEIMQHRDRASWLAVGRGMAAIRAEALRRAETSNVQSARYRYFQSVLMEGAPHLARLNRKDPAGCNHAIWLVKNWSALEGWLRELGPESLRLSHLSSIHRRYYWSEQMKEKARNQGLMDRYTFEKLVECLRRSNAEDAPKMVEVVQGLESALVREPPPKVDLDELGLV